MKFIRLLLWTLVISALACNHSNIDPTATPIRCKTTSEITYLDGVQSYKTLTTYDEHFSPVKEEKYSGTYGPYFTIYQNTYEGNLLIKSIPFENNTSYGQTVYTYHQNKQLKSQITTKDYPSGSHLKLISEYDEHGNQARDLTDSDSNSYGHYFEETITIYTSENAILKQTYTQNQNGDIITYGRLNEYNSQNQLVKSSELFNDGTTNSLSITEFMYKNEKLTQEDYYYNGIKTGRMLHEYNGANQLVKSTYTNDQVQNVINYIYNQQGKLSVKVSDYSYSSYNERVEYSYYSTGALQTTTTYTIKRNSSTKTLESMRRYDEQGNELESIVNGDDGISYDGNGVATPVKSLRIVTEYVCR